MTTPLPEMIASKLCSTDDLTLNSTQSGDSAVEQSSMLVELKSATADDRGRGRPTVLYQSNETPPDDRMDAIASLQDAGDIAVSSTPRTVGLGNKVTTISSRAAEPAKLRHGFRAPDLLTDYEGQDVGNAQRIAKLFGGSLRYCYEFKKWLVYDRRRWEVATRDQARTRACQTMREFRRQAEEVKNEDLAKFAASCFTSARITNALREAQTYLPIGVTELDSHPHLMSFLNGTVDLRTGKLTPHVREHFITKLIDHNYNPEADCPVFLQFLHRVMGGGPNASDTDRKRAERLVLFLQKAFGYSLTGLTSEKVVFLLYGSGNNGKSTLLATMLKLLNEHGVVIQIDSLMAKQESNNSQADLADLCGVRFVMTSETEEGQRLAEGKLKRITQGTGRIKAVRKYENPIEFEETHKIWIDANHLPTIRGTDNAIWNRLVPIPFEVTIPKAEQDRELPTKLLAEAEGILAWAVQGAVRWYAEGLGRPPEIEQASAEWRADSDQLGRFIEEWCLTGSGQAAKAQQLFLAYQEWYQQTGERPETQTTFGKRLVERGYEKKARADGKWYFGIGLRDQMA